MNLLPQIKAPIYDELKEFKESFNESLASSNDLMCSVIEHIKQKNGKMMRPMLVLLIAKSFGEINKVTIYSAVALELLHTASLIHDDVVDESELRRGQPSVNAIYGNKVSVLAGDFFLATSLMEVGKTNNYKIVELVANLGKKLSEGELLQLENIDQLDLTQKSYVEVINKKTAALFEACAEIAALSVNAPEEKVLEIKRLGNLIGVCFQIRDDIFDYYENLQIGKPTGKDMEEGKLTLPILYALDKSKNPHFMKKALYVKKGKATPEDIHDLIQFAMDEGGIEYAHQTIDKIRDEAEKIIQSNFSGDIQEALLNYLRYVVNRKL